MMIDIDAVYCLLMAIYMVLAANSEQTGYKLRKFLNIMSVITAILAVYNVIN